MNRYILLGLFYAATASALVPMDAAYYQADVLTQWTDSDPALPQALSSSDPKDFTKSDYGCHSFVYRTADNNYNLYFTTKNPVVITEIENQQKTREITKYNHIKKYRSEKRTRQVQKTREVNKVRTVTKTREVWKTKQVPKVIYPVEKTRYVRKTRTVYAPSWWWAFGMGWYSWEEEYWGPETHTTFEIKYVDQRYRDTETYEEQEPYTDIETYTVTEPYWHLETYMDPEPYTATESYIEPVEVKKVIAKDCKQQPEITNLINYIGTEKHFRFVFDNTIGIVAKASKVNVDQTQGLLSYRIVELTAIDPISPLEATYVVPVTDENNYKQHWWRVNHIHIKKLIPHKPTLSLSHGKNSLNLESNSAKYTDNYDIEIAYNGNDWQNVVTVNNLDYALPYNSQWNLDKTQIRIKACRDNGNTCSQSDSKALSDVITKPTSTDKYFLAIANTINKINLGQNSSSYILTGLPSYGQAAITEDNVLTYIPKTDYLGVDELGYKISHQLFSEIHSNTSRIIIEVVDYKDAVAADKINGNTQIIDAIKQIISKAATGWAELENAKQRAEKLAKNALIEANQALAAAKQQAITSLTTAKSEAARINKITGNTKATDTVKNLINTATTLAELESNKTQAIKILSASNQIVTYEYDELSRLIKVVIPHQELEINYTYDAIGNRLTRYSQLLGE